MGSSDKEPSSSDNRRSGSLELHDYMLREMKGQFDKLGGKVDEGHTFSKEALKKIDDHIVTCEKRYKEMRKEKNDNSPSVGTPFLIPRQMVRNKLIEKGIDYFIFVVIAITIFAFKNGFHLPVPN